MSQESAAAVAVEAESSLTWPSWPATRRDITIGIDSANGLMTVSPSAGPMGNGNQVVWTVPSIAGYTVEIELDAAKADPASLSQGAGTTVDGYVQLSSVLMGVRDTVTYSVFLKKTADGSRTQLKRVSTLPMDPTKPTLPDPTLMIDRMGDPPAW